MRYFLFFFIIILTLLMLVAVNAGEIELNLVDLGNRLSSFITWAGKDYPASSGFSRPDVGKDRLPVTVLSWNINGPGKADPRRRMIDSVISCVDPDIMLLQETKNNIITRFRSRNKYNSEQAGYKEEAQVLYKKNMFEKVSPSTLNSEVNNILDEMFPAGETPNQLRSGSVPAKKVIRDRICVVHLRHIRTKNEIILISYHNIRKGGGPGAVRDKASEVCQLIAKLQDAMKCCLIAGVDFNCSKFHSGSAKVLLYKATLRRQTKANVDFFILQEEEEVNWKLEAFNLFPQDKEQPFNKYSKDLSLFYNEKEYDQAIDHDPLMLSLFY